MSLVVHNLKLKSAQTAGQMYMSDMIKERREAEKKEEKADLFSNLLDASEAEGDDELKLTDSELIGAYTMIQAEGSILMPYAGNIFIFLIAGKQHVHERNMLGIYQLNQL